MIGTYFGNIKHRPQNEISIQLNSTQFHSMTNSHYQMKPNAVFLVKNLNIKGKNLKNEKMVVVPLFIMQRISSVSVSNEGKSKR